MGVLKFLLLVAILAAGGFALYALARQRPQDVPWTRLELGQPIGLFTGRKLTALTGEAAQCRALLARAGVGFTPLPPRDGAGACGYGDGVRLTGGTVGLRYAPPLAASCAVAASLAVWEWEVVQPAALRRFGVPVARVDQFGAYACRPIAGSRRMSEHATADAVDVAGFRLADGRRITVAGDWRGNDAGAAFLRDVRDGACRLFATVLSPDYNAAHRDHLHLDQAERGAMGWRGCN